jgi:multidrug resistance efflux pump
MTDNRAFFMGTESIERHPVAQTVAANKVFFWFFGVAGLVLVAAGLLSLRMEKTIRASGVVMAAEEYFVFAPAAGILEGHAARIGDQVEAGEPLFSLAGDDLDLKILEKDRQLHELRARIEETAVALREAEIRPAEPALMTAKERLELLEQIRSIQGDIVQAWERLEGERAIRGLEYNLQRVASLRTRLEEIDSRLLAQWSEAGLVELRRESLDNQARSLEGLADLLDREIRLLQKQRDSLRVAAPISGRIVDIYYRYPGMALREGDRVLKIVNEEACYRVKAFVGERNVDLLQVGTRARMESQVFDSLFEGYVRGRVSRIVGEASRGVEGGRETPLYEVNIRVEETPYPLVLGSRMEIDFLLGRESLLALMLNRAVNRRAERASAPEESSAP